MTNIKKIKIGATTYNIGKEATSTESGWLSSTDKVKLDSITHGAEPTKIPTGGATGQVLVKNSDTSYDLAWHTINVSSGTGNTTALVIDSALSTTSTNPVRNSVITSELNTKAPSSHTHNTSAIVGLSAVATTGSYNDLTNTPTIPESYVLPKASASTLGGIKVGSNLSISADGTLSATGGGGSGTSAAYSAGTGITISDYTVSVTTGTYAPYSHVHSAAEITSGTLSIDRIPTGSASNQVALGNHTHSYDNITGTPSLATVASTGSYTDLTNKPTIPSAYTLPTASSSTLGGIKVGNNLSISNGTLSATDTIYSVATTSSNGLMSSSDKVKLNGIATSANNYTLPTASSSVLGGVKVGSGLTINSGVLSATGGGSGSGGTYVDSRNTLVTNAVEYLSAGSSDRGTGSVDLQPIRYDDLDICTGNNGFLFGANSRVTADNGYSFGTGTIFDVQESLQINHNHTSNYSRWYGHTGLCGKSYDSILGGAWVEFFHVDTASVLMMNLHIIYVKDGYPCGDNYNLCVRGGYLWYNQNYSALSGNYVYPFINNNIIYLKSNGYNIQALQAGAWYTIFGASGGGSSSST